MAADEGALTPTADDIEPMLDPSEVVEREAVEEAVEGDKELASLYASRGWQRIAKAMQAEIDGFRTGKFVNLEGASIEDIGKKFIIASTVADRIQSYLDMVNNAAEAVAQYERRKQRNATK